MRPESQTADLTGFAKFSMCVGRWALAVALACFHSLLSDHGCHQQAMRVWPPYPEHDIWCMETLRQLLKVRLQSEVLASRPQDVCIWGLHMPVTRSCQPWAYEVGKSDSSDKRSESICSIVQGASPPWTLPNTKPLGKDFKLLSLVRAHMLTAQLSGESPLVTADKVRLI